VGKIKYTVNEHGALSSHMLYSILKRISSKSAPTMPTRWRVKGKAPFMRASTHWLRHTYAHKALEAAGGNLSVVQELLGHKNINTTAIYVKAGMGERIRAVDKMKTSI
jgi:site-specific recombinase XerD